MASSNESHVDLEDDSFHSCDEEVRTSSASVNEEVPAIEETDLYSSITGMDCRICSLSFDETNEETIELGCSCKEDLAVAHKTCAKKWFTIKGDTLCEICGSIANNVDVAELWNEALNVDVVELWNEALNAYRTIGVDATEHLNETINVVPTAAATAVPLLDPPNSWLSYIFIGFLLTCMTLAFVFAGIYISASMHHH